MLGEEVDFGPYEILGDILLRRHMRDTAQGEDVVWPPRFQQRTRELECVEILQQHLLLLKAQQQRLILQRRLQQQQLLTQV